MHRFGILAALAAAFALAGCAPPATVKPTNTITLNVDTKGAPAADADLQKVEHALEMIQAGHIQLAIDGPLDEVVANFEKKYLGKPVTVYCANGLVDALTYAVLADKAVSGSGNAKMSVEVLGPAWARAYWARGYAYSEMARFSDAQTELHKALALSPMDSRYKSELAFTYEHSGDWQKMLALYQEAADDAEISAATPELAPTLKCVALRGQGYALVELHRLDDAATAYQGCLKLVPNEPKSLAELGYIKALRAKSH